MKKSREINREKALEKKRKQLTLELSRKKAAMPLHIRREEEATIKRWKNVPKKDCRTVFDMADDPVWGHIAKEHRHGSLGTAWRITKRKVLPEKQGDGQHYSGSIKI